MARNISLDQVISQEEDVCAVERIHAPGEIQPHGILVILEPRTLVLLSKSANVEAVFPKTQCGQSPAWLPADVRQACLSISDGHRTECLILAAVDGLGLTEIHCFAAGDAVGCEFEIPSQVQDGDPPTAVGSLLAVAQATEAIGATKDMADLASVAAGAIRQISGFEGLWCIASTKTAMAMSWGRAWSTAGTSASWGCDSRPAIFRPRRAPFIASAIPAGFRPAITRRYLWCRVSRRRLTSA